MTYRLSPYAHVYSTAAQNAVNNTFTKIGHDSISSQSSDHAYSTANKNYIAPRAGRLRIFTTIGIANANYGQLVIGVFINGTEYQRGPQLQMSTAQTAYLNAVEVPVALGDAVDVRIFQNSGGPDRAIYGHSEYSMV